MILIADSGSTKTDWRIINSKGEINQAKTQGFNPYYQKYEEIRDEINTQLLEHVQSSEIQEIYFYGAGCSSQSNCNIVSQALKFSFPDAQIEVTHDLLAAARSLCGHEPGIACILGTGSNSCVFDGDKIIDNIPSLGYVIADEGGGTFLGKKLIADYLRKEMPADLERKMHKRFDLNKNTILDKVYNQEKPGRFIASFTKFIFDNIRESYMHDLVYNSFTEFFENNIVKYKNYKEYPIHFTGGVAFYFNDILRKVTTDQEMVLKNVVENPIAGLTLFHMPA